MGMATGDFAASPEDVQDTEHTLIRGFDDILWGRSASTWRAAVVGSSLYCPVVQYCWARSIAVCRLISASSSSVRPTRFLSK